MFEGHAILGAEGIDYATYWSVYRPDGNFTGGANGVIFTPQAEAAAYETTASATCSVMAPPTGGAYYFFSAWPTRSSIAVPQFETKPRRT
jgi:hypothetical protein